MICQYCNKTFDSSYGLNPHMGWCKNNPNNVSKNRKSNLSKYNLKRKKQETNCLKCDKLIKSPKKYCSKRCYSDYRYEMCINEWKKNPLTGLETNGVVTSPVKKYLREKYNNKCSICEWSKINPYTNLVPLVADHIDGNYLNNEENNLRLVCWNCDSLGKTFGALNMGNGRKNRKK